MRCRILGLTVGLSLFGLAQALAADAATAAEEGDVSLADIKSALEGKIDGEPDFALIFTNDGRYHPLRQAGAKETAYEIPPFQGKRVIDIVTVVIYEGSHCYSYYKNGAWQEYCPPHQ